MKIEKFSYEVKAWVELRSLEIDVLRECSAVHYDVACRRFFSPGNEGYYWPDTSGEHESALLEIDQRSLGRCLKILEVRPPDLEGPARELADKIREVRDLLSREKERLRLEQQEKSGAGP
jgi:hypothetical protein